MKVSTFLVAFKNIIILLWWILVIVFFKIYNNYEFTNGESLIFISLLIIPPFIVYILLYINKKKKIIINNIKKGPYFSRIKNDVKNKTWNRELISKLNLLLPALICEEKDDIIIIKNSDIEINFKHEYTSLKLIDTKVEYLYYYGSKVDQTFNLEIKNLKYKSTIYLYKLLLSKIEVLAGSVLEYRENKNGCMLISNNTKNILYNSFPKKKDKKILLTKTINLKNEKKIEN